MAPLHPTISPTNKNHTYNIPKGPLHAGALLFRLSKGRVPLVRVAAATAFTGGVPTLKTYAKRGGHDHAWMQRLEEAWRQTMLGLGGQGGRAFRRAWGTRAAPSAVVCTAPACGLVCGEGGVAALLAHVAAEHSGDLVWGEAGAV